MNFRMTWRKNAIQNSLSQTSYILDGWKYNIIEIGMIHQIPISIGLYLPIYNVALLNYHQKVDFEHVPYRKRRKAFQRF